MTANDAMPAVEKRPGPPGTLCPGYLPIGDYGLIGNCRTAALISRQGSIDWYCPGRFDAPALFCRILDATVGGFFSVAPREVTRSERSYLEPTTILRTIHYTPQGRVAVSDFMPMSLNAPQPLSDTTGSPDIVRVIEVLDGDVEIVVRLKPTCDYGRAQPTFQILQDGVLAATGDLFVGLHCPTEAPSSVRDGVWEGVLRLRQGECRALRLIYGHDRDDVHRRAEASPPAGELEGTKAYWEAWAGRCTYRGPYAAEVMRSALTLKLLTYEATGAIVAAPTTSLPEALHGIRNWDYRYTWLRDSCLILYALAVIGYRDEATDFLRWLAQAVGTHLPPQIMYTIDGKPDITERVLDWLSGYCNSRPVRVGNAAADQVQLDVYGEVLLTAYLHYHQAGTPNAFHPSVKPPDEATWGLLRALVNETARSWQEPDEGIWEVRGGPQQFTYSKVMCWAALDRGIRLAQEHNLPADLASWTAVRDEIKRTVLERGYNRKLQAFVQTLDGNALDAAVLAIPRVGFLPPTDPRVLSTIARIMRDLTQHGLVYRYLSPDGLAGGEGAFLTCTFWLIDALVLAGKLEEANRFFQTVLQYQNDLGLFSEEADPATGLLLGNFPQGFTHLALIRAAVDTLATQHHGPEEEATTEATRAHRAKRAIKHEARKGKPTAAEVD